MPPENVYKFISASVVPVVIISACGLLGLAFYNRMATLVSRIREFQRERLTEHDRYLHARAEGRLTDLARRRHQQLRQMLQIQTTRVTRRARLMQLGILCLLATIASLTICSLALGLSTFHSGANYIALVCFVFGGIFLLMSVILAAVEMKAALDPVEQESQFVSRLSEELEQQDTGPSTGR
ncbi:MAG TPA: DUF2721 domain-containing protein [Phycisphaerae bacterium]|nr:DUF2721 domain-containing protein [Phycisphaerae bacterium]